MYLILHDRLQIDDTFVVASGSLRYLSQTLAILLSQMRTGSREQVSRLLAISCHHVYTVPLLSI